MASTGTLSSPPDDGFEGLATLTAPPGGADHAERCTPQDIIHEVEFLLIKFTSHTGMLTAAALAALATNA
jgi:hypothetical protein